VANKVQKMVGIGSIKVNVAEGNITISLSKEAEDKLTQPTPGGGGISFLGEWTEGYTYAVGDVVIRAAVATADESQHTGTYYCQVAHTSAAGNAPPEGVTLTNTCGAMMTPMQPRRLPDTLTCMAATS
jgi:hypothetical protein